MGAATLIRRGLKMVTLTPVVTAQAYTANYCVGPLTEIKGAAFAPSGVVLLKSALGLSKGTSDPALQIVLFSQKPTGGTYADATAFAPTSADLQLIAAVGTFGGTWHEFSANSFSTTADLDLFAQCLPDPNNSVPGLATSLWVQLVTTGTPTFASTSDLTVKLALEQY